MDPCRRRPLWAKTEPASAGFLTPETYVGGPLVIDPDNSVPVTVDFDPKNECPNCGRQFKDGRGVARHIKACIG